MTLHVYSLYIYLMAFLDLSVFHVAAFEPFTSSIDKEIQKDIFKREMPDPTSLPPWDPAHIIDYEDCDANKTRCKVAAILHSFNDLQCDDLTDCEWATPVSCTKYIQVPLSGYGDRYEIKCVPDTCQYDTKGKCVCGG